MEAEPSGVVHTRVEGLQIYSYVLQRMEKYTPLLVASYLKRTHTSISFYSKILSLPRIHILYFLVILEISKYFYHHFLPFTFLTPCDTTVVFCDNDARFQFIHGVVMALLTSDHIATGMRKSSSKPRRKGKHKKPMAFLV